MRCALFRTNDFNVLRYRSIWYMHLCNTGPTTLASSARCTIRWTMTSKNDEEKIISILQSIKIVWYCNRSRSLDIRFFKHKSNMLNSINSSQTSLGKKLLATMGYKHCMNTWQSWLFMPWILYFSYSHVYSTSTQINWDFLGLTTFCTLQSALAQIKSIVLEAYIPCLL